MAAENNKHQHHKAAAGALPNHARIVTAPAGSGSGGGGISGETRNERKIMAVKISSGVKRQ